MACAEPPIRRAGSRSCSRSTLTAWSATSPPSSVAGRRWRSAPSIRRGCPPRCLRTRSPRASSSTIRRCSTAPDDQWRDVAIPCSACAAKGKTVACVHCAVTETVQADYAARLSALPVNIRDRSKRDVVADYESFPRLMGCLTSARGAVERAAALVGAGCPRSPGASGAGVGASLPSAGSCSLLRGTARPAATSLVAGRRPGTLFGW